jgi:hypothetical protein
MQEGLHQLQKLTAFVTRVYSVAEPSRVASHVKISSLCQNRVNLPEVVHVVSGHGFDDGLKRHLAALRMRQ